MTGTTSDASGSSSDKGEASPAAPTAKPSSTGHHHHHVCPFCGSLNEDESKPCPKCTLADTPAMRQATKARIGPWYVLQTRNPAAPGMRFATLQALVRKGLVTPASIVRGPTTHQLWKTAARVKGLSRELGRCYGCGEQIKPTTETCPHCNRPQLPPTDPDALLEALPAPYASGNAPAATATPAAPPPAPPAPAPPPAAAPRVEEPPSPVTILTPLPPTPPLAPSRSKPGTRTEPAREPATPDLLTLPDLAKAFHLGFLTPDGRRKKLRRRAKQFGVVALIAIGIGAVFYFDPTLPQSIQGWVHSATGGSESSDHTAVRPPSPANRANGTVARLASERAGPATAPSDAVGGAAATTTQPSTNPSLSTAVEAAGMAADLDADRDNSAEEARKLYRAGLLAESHRDFKAAVTAYEKIKSLPKNVWPPKLETRLEMAQQEMKAGTR
jgi:hypothetical protein